MNPDIDKEHAVRLVKFPLNEGDLDGYAEELARVLYHYPNDPCDLLAFMPLEIVDTLIRELLLWANHSGSADERQKAATIICQILRRGVWNIEGLTSEEKAITHSVILGPDTNPQEVTDTLNRLFGTPQPAEATA